MITKYPETRLLRDRSGDTAGRGENAMRYGTVIPGRFVDRPNRFVARVETAEGMRTVHVKNTGRCRELLIPGTVVYLERGENPGRKTAFDLIAVEKGDRKSVV